MISSKFGFNLILIALLSGASVPAIAQVNETKPASEASDDLHEEFRDPPATARPRVWWHWMNGNITQDGIRKDLEWMHRIGIGGVQNFDAALLTPQIVEERLSYMSPPWKDAFRYATETADRLGLEFAIASSPGWSLTGGPWVQPEDALKKLVWSDTIIAGGRRFTATLAPPPRIAGPFQDMGLPLDPQTTHVTETAEYGTTIAVLAIPEPGKESDALPRLTAGNGEVVDAMTVADGSMQTTVDIPKGTSDQPGVIQIDYPDQRTIRSVTLAIPGAAAMFIGTDLAPQLEVSDENGVWQKVVDIPLRPVPTTISFPAVTGQQFRVLLKPIVAPPFSLGEPAPGAIDTFPSMFPQGRVKLAELVLSEEAKINEFELKAGYFTAPDYYALDAQTGSAKGIAPEKVIDLTGQLKADGTLDWTPPPGNWRVLRIGYSLTGKRNHPATAEATGLEVDKFDGAAVRRYLDKYFGMYRDVVGEDGVGQHGIRALVVDSIEAGGPNWTPDMIDRFKELRGYDPLPWLPALTGIIIGSREQSNAFLYDYRKTLADLLAVEHYGTIAKVAHENGLVVYGEALEGKRPTLGNDLAMRSYADIPMAALWSYGEKGPNPTSLADLKGASSIAHLTGKKYVAAESLTSAFAPWAFAPRDLQPMMDLILVSGINRPVIHTSVHQPVDDKVPGLSLSIFGQHFSRHESWAEMARPWIDYIARSSYLLQQGTNVADIAYFFGEEAPLTALYVKGMPTDAPSSHAYDFVDATQLQSFAVDADGQLRSSGGARYQAIYLGGSSQQMTLATLQKLAALARQGATIIGTAPTGSPALKDDPAAFAALAEELWSGAAVTRVGSGQVIASNDTERALASADVQPDFSYTGENSDAQILFVHRRSDSSDIYFLTNRKDRFERVEANFRVTGKKPEIWRATTGTSEPLSYRMDDSKTVVPLDLAPNEAFFVVFRDPAVEHSQTVEPTRWETVANIGEGPWDVTFQPNRGAPAKIRLDKLVSLSTHADPAVRYFSGVATYHRTFVLPQDVKPGAPLMLDLGDIGDVAEVRVNGKSVGTAWTMPNHVEIGDAVQPGTNKLEIAVANLWVNRLIGDAQPGVTEPISFTTEVTYRPDTPLRPSGLIGPVTLQTKEE